jgi:hypothetical protein
MNSWEGNDGSMFKMKLYMHKHTVAWLVDTMICQSIEFGYIF